MMNFIPIFPLSIAPYPNQSMALNIFEDRYKQLIQECIHNKKPFGIPIVAKGGLEHVGMLVSVENVQNVYDDGRMLISVKGKKIFHLLEVIESMPDKLYKGAIVKYPHNDLKPHPVLFKNVLTWLQRLFELSGMKYAVKENAHGLLSYDIADFVGFTLDQKIEFLSLLKEGQRLEYIRRHLLAILPIIESSAMMNDALKDKGFSLDNFSLN